jgi:hypothetical protein
MFEFKKDPDVPPTIRPSARGRRRKYPFEEMGVGDYFFVPGKTRNTLGTYVCTVGKQLGRKFATRLTYMRRTPEGWERVDADDPGAQIGVWVGRMK